MINRYDNYNLEIVEDDYKGNQRIPGTYKMVVRVKYSNGNEEDINLAIYVNDNEHDFVNEQLKDNLFDLSFFKVMWNSIVLFFKNTWNWFINSIVNPLVKWLSK